MKRKTLATTGGVASPSCPVYFRLTELFNPILSEYKYLFSQMFCVIRLQVIFFGGGRGGVVIGLNV